MADSSMLYCYIAIISRLISTNMELMQLARIETMCNDQGVIQDFRLGGETATSGSKNYVTMGSGGKGAN